MKTLMSVLKSTAIGGVVFLIPLVLLVVIVGKAFNIIKTVSTPMANLISAEKVAGYAVADLLAVRCAFLASRCWQGYWPGAPFSIVSTRRSTTMLLQVFPGYAWIKGMTGSLSDSDAQKVLEARCGNTGRHRHCRL